MDRIYAAFDWVRRLDGVPRDAVHHAEGDVGVHTPMAVEALAAPAWRTWPEPDRVRLFATATELGDQLGSQVLNLACPGASIESGLRGQQLQGGRELPAQGGRLKQVQGLKFVVVAIGPNDLAWTDLLKYCYAVQNCQDSLTQGEFEYRLAAFDRSYGNLLQDLNDLPNRSQIIVVGSYDVFQPDANCADA